MSDSLIYKDASGANQAVDLTLGMYAEAAENNQSLKQYMAVKYPTNAEKYVSGSSWIVSSIPYSGGDCTYSPTTLMQFSGRG